MIIKHKAAGWSLDRVDGSRYIFAKDGKAVPALVHGGRDSVAGRRQAEMRINMEIRYPAHIALQADGSYLVTFDDLVDPLFEHQNQSLAQGCRSAIQGF